VHGYGQRFQERTLLIGDKIRETVNSVLRYNKVRGESSLTDAVLIGDILAEMIFSPQTKIALAAGDHGFNRHPVSRGNFPYVPTPLDYCSGNFVADGHGKLSEGMLPFIEVKITTADTAGFDLD
jgi:hypothetical protein